MRLIVFLFLLIRPIIAEIVPDWEEHFEQLTGKELSVWQELNRKEDFSQLQKYKNLFLKNQKYQFVSLAKKSIPPVVHFIWLGPRPFPIESIKNVRSWMQYHPTWTFKLWTDRIKIPPCKGMQICSVDQFHFEKLGKLYHASHNWGHKSDILRYEILKQEGGVYADHDAGCLQSFEMLNHGYDFYGCLEVPRNRIAGFSLTAGIGLIGAIPNHPVINEAIDKVAENEMAMIEAVSEASSRAMTGLVLNNSYIALTKALQTHLDQEGYVDIVFPAAYFFADLGLKSIYSKHYFASSWVEEKKDKNYQNKIRDALGIEKNHLKRLYVYFFAFVLLITISLILFRISFRRKV